MFSEIWRNYDVTEIWVQNPDGKLSPLTLVEPDPNSLRLTARTLPTAKNWRAWMKWVSEQAWIRCGETAHLPIPRQRQEPVAWNRITLRFRRVDFDVSKGQHRAEEIASYSVEPISQEKRSSP